MDIQVQELLDTIKKDGIDAAEKKAEEIIEAAKRKAASLIADAEKNSRSILDEQEKTAAQMVDAGKAAIAQAGRDLILAVEQQLKKIFGKLVSSAVSSAYDENVLAEAIKDVVASMAKQTDISAVTIPDATQKRVVESLKGKIAEALKDGVTVQTSPKLSGGFLILEKNGAAYFDFSAQAVAEALAVYLNPTIAEILSDKQ